MAEENLSLKGSWSSREPPYQTASADPFTRERVKHLFHPLSCSKDELLDLKETEQNGHWYVYHAALEACLTWNKTFSCPPLEKILHSDKDSTAKEKHQKILVFHKNRGLRSTLPLDILTIPSTPRFWFWPWHSRGLTKGAQGIWGWPFWITGWTNTAHLPPVPKVNATCSVGTMMRQPLMPITFCT